MNKRVLLLFFLVSSLSLCGAPRFFVEAADNTIIENLLAADDIIAYYNACSVEAKALLRSLYESGEFDILAEHFSADDAVYFDYLSACLAYTDEELASCRDEDNFAEKFGISFETVGYKERDIFG